MQKRLGKDAEEAAASGTQLHPDDELYAVPSDLQVCSCKAMHCHPFLPLKQSLKHSLQLCWNTVAHAAQQSALNIATSCDQPLKGKCASQGRCGKCARVFQYCCHDQNPMLLLNMHALVMQGQSTKAQDPGAWATGIVEVALPVEYKMRNIEETEAAKRRLLHASRSAFSLMVCIQLPDVVLHPVLVQPVCGWIPIHNQVAPCAAKSASCLIRDWKHAVWTMSMLSAGELKTRCKVPLQVQL